MMQSKGPTRPSEPSVPSLDGLQVTKCRIAENKLAPGENFSVVLEVKNRNPFKASSEWAIFLDEDKFFACSTSEAFEPLGGSNFREVVFHVTVKPVSNIENLPHYKLIQLINRKQKVLGEHQLELSIAPYIKFLLGLRHLNILLCGMFGTGKSSFVNSTYSLINPDPYFQNAVLHYAIARPSSTTVTTKFTRYSPGKKAPGSQRPIPANINITLVDTWGFEPSRENFPAHILPYMLNGSLPDSWDVEELSTFLPEEMVPDGLKAVNVAFIVTTPQAANNSSYVDFIQQTLIPEFTSRVLLTQIDTVIPDMRKHFDFEDPALLNLVRSVGARICVDPKDVVPVVNYTEENTRSFDIDKSIFIALRKAFLASPR